MCEVEKGKVSFSSFRAAAVCARLNSLDENGIMNGKVTGKAIEQVFSHSQQTKDFPFMKLVDNTMSRRAEPEPNSPFIHSHSINWVLLRDYKTAKLFIFLGSLHQSPLNRTLVYDETNFVSVAGKKLINLEICIKDIIHK